ncbi:P-loop containing nucleoside triphosphate hydrolase protein [Mycena capillaripes]|nr:P-loop containing nucleoside triphosphate hydrolase protein [Mycena capillaripes]
MQYDSNMVGDEKIGRESFACRFAVMTYDPTWEHVYRRMITVDGRQCFVQIDMYHPVDQDAHPHAFIFMYSVASHASFDHLEEPNTKMKVRPQDRRAPMFVLVGTQCDVLEKRREVSTEQSETRARALGCPFFETSAKTGHNVHAVVEGLVRQVRARRELWERSKEVKVKAKKSRCPIQ